jgi:hypothetical protein
MIKDQKLLNNCFDKPNYRLFKLYLLMVGFWPSQNRRIQHLIRILQFVGVFSATVLEVLAVKIYKKNCSLSFPFNYFPFKLTNIKISFFNVDVYSHMIYI